MAEYRARNGRTLKKANHIKSPTADTPCRNVASFRCKVSILLAQGVSEKPASAARQVEVSLAGS